MDLILHAKRLTESYERFTGKKLIPNSSSEELADLLYNAPFALVSHGTEPDPVFNYGNKTAQKLWELNWDEFTSLPSRLSAEPMAREEREQLLKEVSENGFAENYKGIRISKSGKRFWIKGTTIWNLTDENGNRIGQAAMYADWEYINPS